MKSQLALTAIGLIAAGTIAAHAQDEAPRRERPVPPAMLEKFDADDDGKLSPDERKAARDAQRKVMLEKFDTDKDGKLSPDERKGMREQMEARRAELLEKYDADDDGKLSPDERKAAAEAGEMIPPPQRPQRGEGRPGDRRGKGKQDKPAE